MMKMRRPSGYACVLLAALTLAQAASGLTLSYGGWRELGPAAGTREDYQTLAYELGAPTAPDDDWDFVRDQHHFLVVGPSAWPDGTVVHTRNATGYAWENWGGTCVIGLDATVVSPGFPVPVCVGTDGNVWGFWGPNGQFQVSVNDPQVRVRPAIAARGDGSFDTFYVHGVTCELWHSAWSPQRGWIDEVVTVGGAPLLASPSLGGVDAVWAGHGVSASWNDKILVSYLGTDGRPVLVTGVKVASGREGSNNINWASKVVLSGNQPQRYPTVAFVGTPGGTAPTVLYDDGPNTCLYQQAYFQTVWVWHWWGPSPETRLYWTGPAALPGSTHYCGDAAARGAANGAQGAKLSLWQPNNYQKWMFSR